MVSLFRDDLGDILTAVKRKARRVVISTNGFLTKRALEVMANHKDVGVRISFDGIDKTHDQIRGVENAHLRSIDTLKGLKALGIKDLGIAVTISDQNADELVPLFRLACEYHVELATAILHNAFYFHKIDNAIHDHEKVEAGIRGLMKEYLRSSQPKDWFRAYFTRGLLDHIHCKVRVLKCTMATDSFFIDPYGFVRPCNVMDFTFGNLREKSFGQIWSSPSADEARAKVNACTENCWMIGSVGHLMRSKIWVPLFWITLNKFRYIGAE